MKAIGRAETVPDNIFDLERNSIHFSKLEYILAATVCETIFTGMFAQAYM